VIHAQIDEPPSYHPGDLEKDQSALRIVTSPNARNFNRQNYAVFNSR
jgi:hypothetical protein